MGKGKAFCALATLVWSSVAAIAAPPPTSDNSGRPAKIHKDLFGDPLPERALARMGTPFLRHSGDVFGLAFSPDSTKLASAGMDMTIRVWHLAKRRQICEMKGRFQDSCLAFSPDGKLLAAGSADNDDVSLWDATSGRELRRFSPPARSLSLAFSPDGKWLAVGMGDGRVGLWELASGQQTMLLKGHEGAVRALAYAPDSKRLASGGADKTVCNWNVPAGTRANRLTDYKREIRSLEFSAEGNQLLSVGAEAPEDGIPFPFSPFEGSAEVKSWNATTGKIEDVPLEKDIGHYPVAISPDQRTIAYTTRRSQIQLEQISSRNVLRSWAAHDESVHVLAYSPNGKILASGGGDHVVHLWDSSSGLALGVRGGHEKDVTGVGFAKNGQVLVSASKDGSARIWETCYGKQIHRIAIGQPGPFLAGNTVVTVPGGELVLVASDQLHLIDCQTRVPRRVRDLSQGGSFALSSDGKRVAIQPTFGNGRLIELETGFAILDFDTNSKEDVFYQVSVAFSPDDRLLAVAQGDLGLGGAPPALHLFDVQTGKKLRRLEGHDRDVTCLAFSLDGRILATGSMDQTIRFWRAATGKQERIFARDPRPQCLRFSSDGKMLVCGSHEGPVHVWEVATGEERERFEGHAGSVSSIAFAPDGRTLASGSADTTALVWDLMGPGSDALPEAATLPKETLNQWWTDLKSQDAHRAFCALRKFVARPKETVTYFRAVLGPAQQVDVSRTKPPLDELDDARFEVRKKAFQQLAELGEAVEPALRAALEEKRSLEGRQRIEQLLQELNPARSPVRLRALRAIEALEYIATPEAQELLDELARGADSARQTKEARLTRARLSAR
jgi:WD40 repeat protein